METLRGKETGGLAPGGGVQVRVIDKGVPTTRGVGGMMTYPPQSSDHQSRGQIRVPEKEKKVRSDHPKTQLEKQKIKNCGPTRGRNQKLQSELCLSNLGAGLEKLAGSGGGGTLAKLGLQVGR